MKNLLRILLIILIFSFTSLSGYAKEEKKQKSPDCQKARQEARQAEKEAQKEAVKVIGKKGSQSPSEKKRALTKAANVEKAKEKERKACSPLKNKKLKNKKLKDSAQ